MNIKLYRMTWYIGTCGMMVMCLLLYKLFSMVKGLLLWLALDPMVLMVGVTMLEW
jgi:hypothetical protein